MIVLSVVLGSYEHAIGTVARPNVPMSADPCGQDQRFRLKIFCPQKGVPVRVREGPTSKFGARAPQ
jgi:hypothetical protein